jgi:hypothetical protein
MINMCIICIDESTIVDTTLASQAAGTTRSISIDPTRIELPFTREELCHSDSSDDQQESVEQSTHNDNASEVSLPPTKVDLSRDISRIVVPKYESHLCSFDLISYGLLLFLDYNDVSL